MKKSKKRKNILTGKVFLALFIVAIAGGGFLAWCRYLYSQKHISLSIASQTPQQSAASAKKECASVKERTPEQRNVCYIDHYYKLTQQKDVNFAYKSLLELQKIDDSAKSCHFILHSIGRAAFEKDPENWKENLRIMPTECDYGGIHGILEGYQTAGGMISEDTIPELCGNDEEGGCIHAVGHLVLIEEENDLPKALDLCSSYKQGQERFYCMSGAFMERMMPRNLVTHGLERPEKMHNWWANMNEFEELCSSYQAEPAHACRVETSHAAVINYKGDYRKVFAFCDSLPAQESANVCRRHIIIELIGWGKFDLNRLKNMCKLGPAYDPSFEKDCYDEIVKAAIIGLHPDLLADFSAFCRSLETQYQDGCFQSAVNAIAKRLLTTQEKKKICSQFPSQYHATCTMNNKTNHHTTST